MLRHYLTVAARNLMRHKLYSLINVAGLALGLACVIFIVIFVRYETSYDRWVPDTARLYRLELTIHLPGRDRPYRTALTPFPLASALREDVPGVRATTRLRTRYVTLWVGNRDFPERVEVVDPDFLKVIRLPLLQGDRARALEQPESLVLSEDTARKLFGNANAIGRTVTYKWIKCAHGETGCKAGSAAFLVTGVMRNVPADSQLALSVIAPGTSVFRWRRRDRRHWLSANYFSYVELAPGVKPRSVIAALKPILDRDLAPPLARRNLKGPGSRVFEPDLTPFRAVHLDSAGYVQNMTPPGSWITVYGVAVIGLLILLVACFNFMNMTTARATLRAREISLRKCVGASRRQLIGQLLGESVALALCALVLALVLVEVLLPAFDAFLRLPIAFHYFADWQTSLVILAIALGAGLVSGSYPALILSGFRPGAALRAGGPEQAGSGRLRSVLVVMQFAVSIGLGIAALVVARQIDFARRMDLGFEPNGIIVMGAAYPHTRSFREVLARYPGVLGTALSSSVPFSKEHNLGLVRLPGQPEVMTVSKMRVSPNFPRLYRIPLIAGRLLSASRTDDTLSDDISPGNNGHDILINAAAAARFGYTPRQAIGKTIVFNDSPVRIVGVLGDIKLYGALEPVRPTVFFNDKSNMYTLSVRIRRRDMPATLAFINRVWRRFAGAYPSGRYFLSTQYSAYYERYQRQGTMLEVFVGVAILIACLGLFGLTVFTAERRTKEIGIRKISGARTGQIVTLMLWRISVSVLLANVIAWPAAYCYLRVWLEGYAYRIPLNPAYFLAGGAAALAIAWMTVLAHAMHLARTSPVRALRYE